MRDIVERMSTECLATRARRLNRLVTRIYDEETRPLGITVAQGNLLVGVALAGPVQAVHLGRALDLEKSTVSRNLKLLADRRWVTRGPAIEITAAGRHMLERIYPAWQRAQDKVKARVGAGALAALDTITRGLRDE
jgi:DNA-binding MarR family transcriptional regulator